MICLDILNDEVDLFQLFVGGFFHDFVVEPDSTLNSRGFIRTEDFFKLFWQLESVAVDAQALIETTDTAVLHGLMIIGQRAEEFEKIAGGFAEGT